MSLIMTKQYKYVRKVQKERNLITCNLHLYSTSNIISILNFQMWWSIFDNSTNRIQYICRIESLIIVKCPTFTIESMIMAIAQ